jgi:hypothetical protein
MLRDEETSLLRHDLMLRVRAIASPDRAVGCASISLAAASVLSSSYAPGSARSDPARLGPSPARDEERDGDPDDRGGYNGGHGRGEGKVYEYENWSREAFQEITHRQTSCPWSRRGSSNRHQFGTARVHGGGGLAPTQPVADR